MSDVSLSNRDVVRSEVPELSNYKEYRPYLRRDFFYSCAYCTMSEVEATAIRFTIDHYEPQKKSPHLVNVYENLLYCCDECNTRKGVHALSDAVRKLGYRLFRPDFDAREQHFLATDRRVAGKTPVGEYTVDAVALNRNSLRRLRDLRQRLTNCERFVSEGVLGLRAFPMDSLPKEIKSRAFRAVKEATETARRAGDEIDELLRSACRSPLDGGAVTAEDIDANRLRLARLKRLEGMHPGAWRKEQK